MARIDTGGEHAFDVVEQAVAGVFYQIEYSIETVGTSVVGVWDHRAVMAAAKFRQSAQLAPVCGWTHGFGQGQVVPVHGQQQVGLFEIDSRQLPGAQIGQVVAAQPSMVLAAYVRCLAHVKGMGAGRGHRYPLVQAAGL